MAIVDLPTSNAFRPVLPYSFGVRTPKTGFRGFYTGEPEDVGHLADRLVANLTFPPCSATEAAQREAFWFGVLSRGDGVRFGPHHRNGITGTVSGSPTVSSNALAGARSIAIAGALSRPNLLTGGGFEIDTNADNVSDGWTQYTSGSVGTVTAARPAAAANTGTAGLCQRISSTALNGSIGVRRTADVSVTVGLPYTWSITQSATAGTNVSLEIAWYNGASYLSSSTATAAAANGRRSVTGTAPASATVCKLYVYMTSASSGAAAINVDEAQFEQASAVTAYAGLATVAAGDFLSVGGNLLHVAYGGATATDAGAITVPLTLPLMRAVSAAAAVTHTGATGVWHLDRRDGIDLDLSAASMQLGITLPFRQAAV